MIHEVYEEGAAARDGRLWAGDQILEVCACVRACDRSSREAVSVCHVIHSQKQNGNVCFLV